MPEEMFDVLDENGIPTGEILSRKEVHRNGLWHEATLICIINNKNEILMQKRSKEKEKYAGLWDISVAGHSSVGSFAIDTLFAEMMEEVGVVIPQGAFIRDLKHLKTFRDQRVVGEGFIENQFYNLYVAHLDVDISKVILQEGEVDEVKYMSIFEVKKLADKGLCHPRNVWIDFVYKYISKMAFR